MTENKIVRYLVDYFLSEGFETFLEVPFLSRRIDLVAQQKSTGDLYLVEAKVSNWRKALEQACIYLLCGDYAYNAIAENFVHRVKEDDLAHHGVGLISVNSRPILKRKAEKSRYRSEYYSTWLRYFLRDHSRYLTEEGDVIND